MAAVKKIPRLILYFSCCLLLCSCASTQVRDMAQDGNFKIEEDEARLWKRQEELQEIINKSGFIYTDEELKQYVNNVLHKLVGSLEQANNIKLQAYILKDPLFNAFCLPNGVIYVNTSILANADNEAQLATLLGHEAIHFLHRHGLKQFRSIINKAAFLSTLQVTVASAASGFGYGAYGDLANLVAAYSVIGSVYGYSREIEAEADKEAFALVIKSGYDPRETKKFFENLYEATKDDKQKTPYFYSSHPRTKWRIQNCENLLKSYSKTQQGNVGGITNTEEYNKMIKPVLLDNAELEIKCNNLKLARKEVEKYNGLYPNDFRCYYILGGVDYLEGKKDEAEKALKRSIELNPAYPESHKALGKLFYSKGDKKAAKPEFEKYLQLLPEAKDADYIRRYLNE
ncbi:MAG: M48 family metalloprotease [Candidatus Omnitrophota bacterium]